MPKQTDSRALTIAARAIKQLDTLGWYTLSPDDEARWSTARTLLLDVIESSGKTLQMHSYRTIAVPADEREAFTERADRRAARGVPQAIRP